MWVRVSVPGFPATRKSLLVVLRLGRREYTTNLGAIVNGTFRAHGRASLTALAHGYGPLGPSHGLCHTTTHFSAKALPTGTRLCADHKTGHIARLLVTASQITATKVSCQTVYKALDKGKYRGLAQKFAPPGWTCSGMGTYTCSRKAPTATFRFSSLGACGLVPPSPLCATNPQAGSHPQALEAQR